MTPEHKLFTGKANGSKDLPAQKRSKFNYRTSNPDLPPGEKKGEKRNTDAGV
jgi:hypothetical protein